ncbi:MAG: hypothetical protein ACOYBL_05115 [Lachnospiraceae bacterium]
MYVIKKFLGAENLELIGKQREKVREIMGHAPVCSDKYADYYSQISVFFENSTCDICTAVSFLSEANEVYCPDGYVKTILVGKENYFDLRLDDY